ncbi:hypothetical protein GIB67_038115 [Kingdonia uniflora]|uniref:Protein phosphatase n=1 Tax=Kingdonia uniflora TaxID=39325 RepID=A0A7J7M8Q6_9MAGN|nr:hypothetical protein GIB67_017447 [Kingdonia uniflora]KAF6151222.1 hypothetical protein GIB67_038115 [Kingdonia uniflora]
MQSYFSRLNLALRSGFRRPITGLQGSLQNSVESLLGQGKILLGNSGLSFSLPFSTLGDVPLLLRPVTVFAAKSDSQLANQKRNLSLVGTLSRTICTPSVSCSSFQACEYHIDRLLSDSIKVSPGTQMSTSGSKALLHGSYQDSVALKKCIPSSSTSADSISYSIGTVDKGMTLRNQEPCTGNLYSLLDVAKRTCSSNSLTSSRAFHSSSSSSYHMGAANLSFDGSAREEQSAVSSDQKTLGDRTMKLLSGSCYLPHPDKEDTGGEDAHFICDDEQAIGVADGVGGWADQGIDAGIYARELMSNSVLAIEEEPKGSIDPVRVLEKAHSSTKSKGSSTACIIALTDKGIHAINLGDSGFVIVRDGCTVFRSPVQQYTFNFPYQLESGNNGDLPSSGQVFSIPVAPGDVMIAGTDGLFDNLYNNEVTAVVVHAARAGLGPQVTAQKIAALARQRALDSNRQTPFSTAAQDAGIRYYGGKLDDITVVVSYITGASSN